MVDNIDTDNKWNFSDAENVGVVLVCFNIPHKSIGKENLASFPKQQSVDTKWTCKGSDCRYPEWGRGPFSNEENSMINGKRDVYQSPKSLRGIKT